ncbi:MAG: hypothetical protein AAGC53_14105 [Actinomycetota bacterium]
MRSHSAPIDDGGVRRAYRELIGRVDPAEPWLAAGGVDARFGGDAVPEGAVVRGPADLGELHDIIDDLFGVGCFDRPAGDVYETRRAALVIARPAAVMPFVEALRPCLEGRGPAFWTWKTARETMAVRLQGLEGLTVEAAR